MKNKSKIKIIKDGPYLVSGNTPLQDEKMVVDKNENCPHHWNKGKKFPRKTKYKLCRCGKSTNRPYCDGHHKTEDCELGETADSIPFKDKAEVIDGPELVLEDVEEFCVHAHFCDRASGVWQLTKDSADPKAKKIAIEESCNCPSGRLVHKDQKTDKIIEPKFAESISLTTDENGLPGPLWVKGGIPVISAEGKIYEKRNRVTLCRCGKSQNKPFCDGSHLD